LSARRTRWSGEWGGERGKYAENGRSLRRIRKEEEEEEEEERRRRGGGRGSLAGQMKRKAGGRRGITIINMSKLQICSHIIIPISVQCHIAPCVC